MQLRGDQLDAHLARECLPVYVVHGDEPLLVIEAADAIRRQARTQGFDEREVLTVTSAAAGAFDWSALERATGNLSLFGGRKLVEVRIPGGKPGREGTTALQRYATRPAPDTLLLVSLPELDWREEKAAWITALASAGAIVKCSAPPLSGLPAWIGARLARQGQQADAEGLAFIAERVEGNLLAAQQEIAKLALLCPPGRLDNREIRNAVLDVARFDLDTLREALLAGDIARLTRTLDGLKAEGEAPPLVLWAMTEEVRALAVISAGLLRGATLDALLRDANVRGPRQQGMRRALERFRGREGAARAGKALAEAARIDRIIKGIEPGETWDALLRLALLLTEKSQGPSRRPA